MLLARLQNQMEVPATSENRLSNTLVEYYRKEDLFIPPDFFGVKMPWQSPNITFLVSQIPIWRKLLSPALKS